MYNVALDEWEMTTVINLLEEEKTYFWAKQQTAKADMKEADGRMQLKHAKNLSIYTLKLNAIENLLKKLYDIKGGDAK